MAYFDQNFLTIDVYKRQLQTRLNGVLHKEGSRWMADSINAQGLTFKDRKSVV